jgi:hypothetical protein
MWRGVSEPSPPTAYGGGPLLSQRERGLTGAFDQAFPVFQIVQYRVERAIQIFDQVHVPDAHDSPAFRFKKSSAHCIANLLGRLPVRVAIQLHDQFHFHTGKISKVWTDRKLPPELPTRQLPISKLCPQQPFRKRRVSPQASCTFCRLPTHARSSISAKAPRQPLSLWERRGPRPQGVGGEGLKLLPPQRQSRLSSHP